MVARRVAATVAPHLEWVEGRKSLKKRDSDLQFWEYFHRGNAHLLEFTESGNQAARDVFRAALEFDRESGKAWTGLAYSFDRDLFWGSIMVELTPGRDVAIPSVAPDMRILSYERIIDLQRSSRRSFWTRPGLAMTKPSK